MSDQASDSRPDDELVGGIANGDQTALTALFRRRYRDVYGFALHLTGSTAAAEDVTQETFMAVMRDAGRFDAGRATAIAWLCGIARNQARRRLERERPALSLDDDNGGAEPPGLDRDPVADLTRAQDIEAVRRAVWTLPLRYREAVVLCDLQELSYLDAADAIGCAVGTVRSRLHRGRAMLAAKLWATGLAAVEPARGAGTARSARCST